MPDRIIAPIVGPAADDSATASAFQPMAAPSCPAARHGAQQRNAERHDGGTPEALEEAGRDEPRQGRRDRAQRRRCGEQRNAPREYPGVAQAFPERGARQKAHHQGRLIGRDDPYRRAGCHLQRSRDASAAPRWRCPRRARRAPSPPARQRSPRARRSPLPGRINCRGGSAFLPVIVPGTRGRFRSWLAQGRHGPAPVGVPCSGEGLGHGVPTVQTPSRSTYLATRCSSLSSFFRSRSVKRNRSADPVMHRVS